MSTRAVGCQLKTVSCDNNALTPESDTYSIIQEHQNQDAAFCG